MGYRHQTGHRERLTKSGTEDFENLDGGRGERVVQSIWMLEGRRARWTESIF